MKFTSAKILIGLFVIVVVSGLLVVWFGAFDVSASKKHWGITASFLELVRERSIQARTGNIQVPDIDNITMISNGAQNYAAMCAQCHLAPGVEESELYQGLNPQPPVLYQRKPMEQNSKMNFWVIKNGIKMTGMPAWGAFHTDEQIWELVAFINAMNGMSPEKYKQLVGDGKHTHANGEHGGEQKTQSTHNADHHVAEEKSVTTHSDAHNHHDDGNQH